MHILAALTEPSTPAIAAAQTKGSKESGDFEAAFLDAGETALSSKDAPILEEAATDEILVDKANLKSEPEDDAPTDHSEVDDLELLKADTSRPSFDEKRNAEGPLQASQGQRHSHMHADVATDPPPQESPDTKPKTQNDIAQNMVAVVKGQEQNAPRPVQERAVPNVHLNAVPPQTATQATPATKAAPAERLSAGQLQVRSLESPQAVGQVPVPVEAKGTTTLSAKTSAVAVPSLSPDAVPVAQPRPVETKAETRPRDMFHEPRSAPDTFLHKTATAIPNPVARQAPLSRQEAADPTAKAKIESLFALKPDAIPDDASPLVANGRSEVPQIHAAVQTSVLQHPQLPQHIARQMAEALQKGSTGPVEVALSPEELGRIKMRINVQDGGIVINILAERTETLDLMRRHADQLGQEFEEMGFGSVSFGFATSGEDTDSTGDHQSDPSSEHIEDRSSASEPAHAPLPSPQVHMTQGVDIRL